MAGHNDGDDKSSQRHNDGDDGASQRGRVEII